MSRAPQLDGRRAKALQAELQRRAEAVLSGDGRNPPAGPVTRAILGVAARIGEEVTRRLDQAPAKQTDNFYTAAGIGRDPARAAIVPVALKLVEGATKVLSAPAQLQLMVDAGGPVVFETETRIDLAPGTIAALRGIDVAADAITIPSGSVMAAGLPRTDPLVRRLRSGAAAGATKLQIDPAAGLAPGMLLRIGEGETARHYEAIAVEGDLVTVEPPLEIGLAQDMPALEVSDFAPFASVTRNHQAHAFYIGHASLLDVPSAVTITISGTSLPDDAVWSWWGQLGDDDPPAWQLLGSGTSFTKLRGKLVKKDIRGHESLWLRAKLPDKSAASAHGRNVRIAIGGGGPCGDRSTRCTNNLADMNIGFEAIANTTPVVTNSPFHPFGREPRLYDSFYVGSDEAFSKVGADISLCFNFAGADLGRMAAIKEIDTTTRIFAVGIDGLLYRALLPPVGGGTAKSAELRPVQSPSKDNRNILFQSYSPIALWKNGAVENVAVAAAGGGAIYVAELKTADDTLKPGWLKLPLPVTGQVDSLAVRSRPGGHVLYALVGTDLFVWNTIADNAAPAGPQAGVRDLVQVEPSDPLTGADTVLIIEVLVSGDLTLTHEKGSGTNSWLGFPAVNLPSVALQAFVDPAQPTSLFISGYEGGGPWHLRLAEIDISLTIPPAKIATSLLLPEPLAVAFSPGRGLGFSGGPPFPKRPILSVATDNPCHVSWYGTTTSTPVISYEPTAVGASANPHRGFVHSADYVAVQRPDVGLFFRPTSGSAIVRDIRVAATPGYLANAALIPASANAIVYFNATGLGIGIRFDAFAVTAPAASGKTILQQRTSTDPPPSTNHPIIAYVTVSSPAAEGGTVAGAITLPGTRPLTGGPTNLLAIIKPSLTSLIEEIWDLAPGSGLDEWLYPGTSMPGPGRYFQLLGQIGQSIGLPEAAVLPMGSTVAASVAAGATVWNVGNVGLERAELLTHTGGSALAYSHTDIAAFGNQALFLAASAPWQAVGPDLTSNPALSWEYWNGQSWWALATVATGPNGLTDDTANFVKDGGVFFKVPADLQPTDVGGRTSHWVRARLVGGDYGEAKVTVTTDPITKDQSVNRDLSTIRAPYVISLRLGYCAQQAVAPEIILTEDSLGAIDQTSANEAGLEFSVFTPVGELMNPVNAAEKAAAAATDAARCEEPCPPPPGAKGSPCDAPGAYDSCDSPCIAPDGHRRAAAGEPQGFVRGLMLGFARGFAGDPISLYVDAEPGGPPTELAAEMLRDGRFVPINVAGDTSCGLTEPGILTLALPVPPDRSDLLGAPAHWLRLRPKTDAANWSPRLRAIHLNAVLARSVETRVMERLGASTGVEGQSFRLSEAPIEPDSLVLRVRETLAEEDDPDGRLDVKPLSLPGHWVRWQVSDDLIEGEAPERAFLLDAEQGIIRFGNGKAGRIPPLGAEIIAESYARVVGNRANGVPVGKQLQLLAPLAGVERATALDSAAGGSDAEALESARRRAPAKVRHGRRILTEADLEDHALTLAPDIAQVRAAFRGGGMRLVVAMKGAEARPLPATLREFAAAIREVAGYGLARPGGLIVVGPRILPIAIALVLQPRSPDLFAEAVVQARLLLVALFDPATGNHDGKGWPLGRLPDDQDVAAALTPIDALALPVHVTLRRADKETAAENILPERIPSDVLVRLDPTAIAFERSQEAAA